MKKKWIFIICICTLAIAIERFYYKQNGGFRVAKVLSSSPSIDTPLTEEKMQAYALLDQPFHFLSCGGTSFVFLGEDGKTVLKLFKHQHLNARHFFSKFRFPGVFDACRVLKIQKLEKRHLHKRKPFFFKSCTIAYEQLKQETGLIFLTLQPDTHFKRRVKLIDAWGIPHYLDLSRTEFALQKKAELLFPFLQAKIHDKEQSQAVLDSLITLIRNRCKKEIGDRDPNLQINFGVIDGKAVEFDLGSYFINPELKSPFAAARELFFSTFYLKQWLKTHAPELLEYFNTQIANALETELIKN
jgi:hypothetical protein